MHWGTWLNVLQDPEWKSLLERVAFYKIGHHGSHNATPIRRRPVAHGLLRNGFDDDAKDLARHPKVRIARGLGQEVSSCGSKRSAGSRAEELSGISWGDRGQNPVLRICSLFGNCIQIHYFLVLAIWRTWLPVHTNLKYNPPIHIDGVSFLALTWRRYFLAGNQFKDEMINSPTLETTTAHCLPIKPTRPNALVRVRHSRRVPPFEMICEMQENAACHSR